MHTYSYKGIITTFSKVAYSIQDARLYYGDEDGQEMRIIDNRKGDWGDIYPLYIINKQRCPLPLSVYLRWITLVDLKCYEIYDSLDTDRMEMLWEEQQKMYPESPFKYVVVGIAPYGDVAIWLRSSINSVLVQQLKADEVDFDDAEFPVYSKMKGDSEVMESMFPKDRFERVMKQYEYRYLALEEYFDGKKWTRYDSDDNYYEKIEVESVEDKRMDGTFDFTDGDSLYLCHTAGMPIRISVRWTENNAYYLAHFWLDDYYVSLFFESFHRKFPETPAELLIRLDTRANRYEVAMTANDLVPREFIGTQYIVLKDFKEVCRSDNYSKQDGEWEWE